MKTIRRSNLKSIIRGTVKQANIAKKAAAARHLETMKRLVPVDEGDLKATLKMKTEADGSIRVSAGSQGELVDGENYVDYEADVEFGTVHTKADGSTYSIPGQPFFRPALEDARKTMRRNMKIVEK